jgi:hypothetical protein
VERRRSLRGKPSEKLTEDYEKSVTELHPGSEVTAVKVENTQDPSKPLAYHYHIRMPNYGQRTGKRIFFQPLFFQTTTTPMFPNADRRYDIRIQYAWKEDDEVTIQLPKDYELESPQAPSGMAFGKPGSYAMKMTISTGGELVSSRQLVFGDNSMLLFAKKVYPQLKSIFDEVHKRDSATLALKQKDPK